MGLQKKFNYLHQEVIESLCAIEEFPDGLLPHTVYKELAVFLYPTERFERNVFDDEILSGWADNYVEKMTPDEFAALINDGGFSDAEYWVRFIEVDA